MLIDYAVLALGAAIILFVLAWIGLSIHQSVQRMRFANHTHRLETELLHQRIASEKTRAELTAIGWNGYRKFEIVGKEEEADQIYSFYLAPHDGKPLRATTRRARCQTNPCRCNRLCYRCRMLDQGDGRSDQCRFNVDASRNSVYIGIGITIRDAREINAATSWCIDDLISPTRKLGPRRGHPSSFDTANRDAPQLRE